MQGIVLTLLPLLSSPHRYILLNRRHWSGGALADSGRFNGHSSIFSRSLFPSLLEHFGARRSAWQSATRPSLRAPLLARPLLVLLSLYLLFRVGALIRYGWYCGW